MTYLLKSFIGNDLEQLIENINTFINSSNMKGKVLDGWMENTIQLTTGKIQYTFIMSYYDEKEDSTLPTEHSIGFRG